MFDYKQVIIIRTDLKMSCGKKVAQGAHASILAAEKVKERLPSAWQSWFTKGQKKVICKVRTAEDLHRLKADAEKRDIPCALVQDAGLTQLEPGTITALGMGPVLESDIDKITGDLTLL